MKRVLGLALSLALVAIASCSQSGGPLKVESVEPPQGTTGGGEEITINGGGFQPEVKFGHKKSETVTIAATNKIRVVTPPNDKGPVDVTVMFDDGSTFKIPNAFRYVEPAAGDNTRQAFFGGQKSAGGANKIEVQKKAQ
jgi:hypothetical protein